MQWSQSVKLQLEQIVAVEPLNSRSDEGSLNALSAALASLDDELREQIQAVTATQVTPLIEKLRAGGPVGPAELELIRLWLVGEAESYVKMEDNFPAWVSELDRLIGVLRQLAEEAMTPSSMTRMEATIRDALRVASDIAFYRQQEERIRSFENATRLLSREDKEALADILAQKLHSELV